MKLPVALALFAAVLVAAGLIARVHTYRELYWPETSGTVRVLRRGAA